VWVVAGASDVYRSVDGGDNWAAASNPPGAGHLSNFPRLCPATNGTRILLGHAFNGAGTTGYAYSDDGGTWTEGDLPEPVEEVQLAYDPSSQLWFAAGQVPLTNAFRTFISEDNGVTFTEQSEITATSLGLATSRVMDIGIVGKVLVVALDSNRVLVSDDLGLTYTDVGTNLHVTAGYAAEKTRILSGPFGPNMYLSFGSVGTGGLPGDREIVWASARNRLY